MFSVFESEFICFIYLLDNNLEVFMNNKFYENKVNVRICMFPTTLLYYFYCTWVAITILFTLELEISLGFTTDESFH